MSVCAIWRKARSLLLTLLCIGFEEAQTFPDRRSEIYQEALDVLLRRWDKSRGIARDPRYQRLSLARKHQMFARIAAETFERGEYLWPLDRLARLVADYMRNIPQIDPQEEIHGADVVKTIEEQHGVFVERAHAVYSFAHLTFQEYYTARYLVEHPAALPNLILKHAHDTRWHEVFLLTTELLADADDFFALWLNALDDMARQSPRLTRLLKLVEVQASMLNWDNNIDEKTCVAYTKYTPLQCRTVIIHLRTRTASKIAAAVDPSVLLSLNAVADIMADAASIMTDIVADAASAVADAAVKAKDARVHLQADDGSSPHYNIIRGFVDSADKAITRAIQFSQMQGLTVLATDIEMTKSYYIGDSQNSTGASWYGATQGLVTVFRTHFPSADYELTTEEAWQVTPYLQSTALLLRCLRNAYVSDIAAIEDRLLRPPAPPRKSFRDFMRGLIA